MSSSTIDRFLSPLSFFVVGFILTAVKFFVIEHYGNATPWWDQWDAEAALLYRPWLQGELRLEDLFAPHNEHRIFTSRLLGLFLLEINGSLWNPILQMQVNSLLHVFSLGLMVLFSTRYLPIKATRWMLVFTAVVFVIPFGWENTLAGFQSQFYFLLLFSFIFLWCMSAYQSYSPAWWIGVFAGCLCALSLASGAISLLAGVFVLVLRRLLDRSESGVSVSSIVLIATIAIFSIALTPTIPGHAPLRVTSLYTFLQTFGRLLSWPEQGVGFGILIIHLPLVLLSVKVLLDRSYRTPSHYYIVAIGAWVFGQFITIAYGRLDGYDASRYQDIYAIGLLVGCAAILALPSTGRFYRLKPFGSALWLGTIAYSFAISGPTIINQLEWRAKAAEIQEKNVSSYLRSGNRGHIFDKPLFHIPYPNAERLRSLLDDPEIRVFLPKNIYVPGTAYDEIVTKADAGSTIYETAEPQER